MKKTFFILIFLSLIGFLGGIFSSNFTAASECMNENENETNQAALSEIKEIANYIFNGKSVFAACTNDVYMGAKWATSYVPIKTSQIDSTTIRNNLNNAITHWNNAQNFVDITVRNSGLGSYGYIYATDDYYTWESWTAQVTNSWYGGWPITNTYNYENPMNMRFNTKTYFDGTSAQLLATPIHEIGHAVGMGHTNDLWTIMYCNRDRNATGLTSKDKQVLGIIY